MDYFEFYDLPRSFLLDLGLLKRLFLQKSKAYHPDRFVNESNDEQEEALKLSTINNQAYQTLKDFDLRMQHVLLLEGIIEKEGGEQLPQDFLMEMMDLNEEVMEIQMSNDIKGLEKLKKKITAFAEALKNGLNQQLEDYGQKNKEVLINIKAYYFKKKYLKRLLDNLNNIVPEV